ncbi:MULTISPECIES: hypothetical protein [unclassified Curtobacterium]|uniref:hypothetical protein n=1 Tax=unclassified Curtobacterium TaxID=257496 RepID=UPI001A9EEA87|nr:MULTISPECIES: hypothetical protein [unclassified Curtobacterium]
MIRDGERCVADLDRRGVAALFQGVVDEVPGEKFTVAEDDGRCCLEGDVMVGVVVEGDVDELIETDMGQWHGVVAGVGASAHQELFGIGRATVYRAGDRNPVAEAPDPTLPRVEA